MFKLISNRSCAQCFRAFQDGIFYEFEGRKYCERDFHVLFAPCCNKCGEFVIGRVIKAMAASWHPQCFCCESCHKELADCGFIRNQVSCALKFRLKMFSNRFFSSTSCIFDVWHFLFKKNCNDFYFVYFYRIALCVTIAMPEKRRVNLENTFAKNASELLILLSIDFAVEESKR